MALVAAVTSERPNNFGLAWVLQCLAFCAHVATKRLLVSIAGEWPWETAPSQETERPLACAKPS